MWKAPVRFDLMVSLGCCLLLAFFAWHAWFGTRSIDYMAKLNLKLSQTIAERDVLEAQRTDMQRRVSLMRPESVDPDLLEELARLNLGWVGGNEIIVKTALQAE